MKYLALDYGQRRVGVAISDAGGRMAFPLRTLLICGRERFFDELLALASSEKAEAFVIGLPLRRDGSDSETTRQVRNMAARLNRLTPLPVYFMDETLSSDEAETRLRETGKTGKRLRETLDQAAAAGILESFLSLPPELRPLLAKDDNKAGALPEKDPHITAIGK